MYSSLPNRLIQRKSESRTGSGLFWPIDCFRTVHGLRVIINIFQGVWKKKTEKAKEEEYETVVCVAHKAQIVYCLVFTE